MVRKSGRSPKEFVEAEMPQVFIGSPNRVIDESAATSLSPIFKEIVNSKKVSNVGLPFAEILRRAGLEPEA